MKVLYRPLSTLAGIAGGLLASAMFKRVWRKATGEEDAPKATDRDYGWREILVAAAVQGAIYGAVKAAVDRAGAAGYERATGDWPGDD
ncbi:uncharacterized protein DUF4235 [Prauserella shujinwangii]|uniref:Uncharacterized protein DUF4235 n=1 Tax=Prauserella shujinwangii TaxID=1453103 RepID=A0A2T0LX94_9PSEU|nr:DUF4235 domain-containing protein [Prauserella shujinwangii]PRX48617.1 uncharacterized protein DUF4235 [Prauserella shujinwangii]